MRFEKRHSLGNVTSPIKQDLQVFEAQRKRAVGFVNPDPKQSTFGSCLCNLGTTSVLFMRFFPHLTYMGWGIIFITDGVEEANDEMSEMKTPAAATHEKQRRDNSCIVRSGRGEGTGPVCLALTGM